MNIQQYLDSVNFVVSLTLWDISRTWICQSFLLPKLKRENMHSIRFRCSQCRVRLEISSISSAEKGQGYRQQRTQSFTLAPKWSSFYLLDISNLASFPSDWLWETVQWFYNHTQPWHTLKKASGIYQKGLALFWCKQWNFTTWVMGTHDFSKSF